jgi:methylthioribose-1-phosphate isomerase
VAGFNPAFDLTPARLVDGLLTEHGMVAASVAGVAAVLLAAASASAASATLGASS